MILKFKYFVSLTQSTFSLKVSCLDYFQRSFCRQSWKDHKMDFWLTEHFSIMRVIEEKHHLLFKLMINNYRTANMDVFTVQTGPGPRARPPSAPTTARWSPGPAAETAGGEVSRQPSGSGPSPPPAYTKLDHKVTSNNGKTCARIIFIYLSIRCMIQTQTSSETGRTGTSENLFFTIVFLKQSFKTWKF